jgi:hypothetical protein
MRKLQAGLLLFAFIAAVVVHLKLRVSLGVAFLIFFVGWPIIGTLLTLDDDLSGGWSNPDGTVRAPWLEAPFWGPIFAGLALSAFGFAADAGWQSRAALPYWLAVTAAGFVAGAMFTRKWWLLAGVVLSVAAFKL